MLGGQIGGGNQPKGSPLRGLLSLVLFGVVIYFAVFAFSFIYKWLWYAVPVFLVATAVVDHKLLLGLTRRLGRLVSRNPIAGLIVGAIVMFSLPFLAPILLLIALITSRLKRRTKQQAGQMQSMFDMFQQQQMGGREGEPNEIEIDYEEISSEARKR